MPLAGFVGPGRYRVWVSVHVGENSPPPNLRVGDYRLLTRIGEGGMGVVHLATKDDRERVALKVLRPHVVGDDEARRRLAREVASLSRVRSPRVAEIVDSDPWGPVPFVATRYVPGLSLHEHIRDEGPLAGEELLHFALGLAEAIVAVHDVGVLHRDIKPSNVLMEGRNPVLIDFGLARVADDANITRTGWLLGTPGYLAPEILYGHEPTAAADVHSWAATVAFAGLGRPPFGRGPSVAVMDRVRRGEHDVDGLGHEVLGPVLKALDPEPTARPELSALIRMLGGPHGAGGGAVAAAAASAAPPTMTMPLATAEDHTPTDRIDPGSASGTRTLPDDPTRAEAPEPPAMAPSYTPYQTPPAPQPHHSPPQHAAPHRPTQPDPSTQADGATYDEAQPARISWLERVRRWTLGGGLLAATTGAVAAAPYLTAILVALVTVTLRAFSLNASASAERRMRRGPKWYDGTLSVVAAPWNFLVSLPASLMLLAWAGLLAGCVGLVMIVLGVGEVATLVACGLTGAVALWTGPGGSRLRSPIESVGFPIAERIPVWLVLSLVLFAIGTGLIAFGSTIGVEWSPTQQSPWESWGWARSRV